MSETTSNNFHGAAQMLEQVVRDEVKRLQDLGVEFDADSILEVLDRLNEVEDDFADEQAEVDRLQTALDAREVDESLVPTFDRALNGHSQFDVLSVGPEGGAAVMLRSVGGTPLTVGDLRGLLGG